MIPNPVKKYLAKVAINKDLVKSKITPTPRLRRASKSQNGGND